MSISPVSSVPVFIPQAKPAVDGDSTDKEAAENAATRQAEVTGGRIAAAQPAIVGGYSKLV